MPGENLREMLDRDPSYLPSLSSPEWAEIEDELRAVSQRWIERSSGRFDPSNLESDKRNVYDELGQELAEYIGINPMSSTSDYERRLRLFGRCEAFVTEELQDRGLWLLWDRAREKRNSPCDRDLSLTQTDPNRWKSGYIAYLEGATEYFVRKFKEGAVFSR